MKRFFIRAAALGMATALFLTACVSARPIQPTKLIALTFDDGPSPEYTPQILDILERKQVNATFFLVGKWLDGNEGIVRRIVSGGSQAASHTWDHTAMTELSDQEIQKSVAATENQLHAITGQSNFMVRPPYGSRSARTLDAVAAPVILWSVDPAAGAQVPSDELVHRALAGAEDGSILLMHDTTQENVDAVGRIIEGLHGRGYEFVTVRELLRLRGITPKDGGIYQKASQSSGIPESNETALARHWAWPAIRDARTDGWMTGDKTGWHPDRVLTRAQVLAALWRASGRPTAGSRGSAFPDMPRDAYYAAAADWALDKGILKGRLDGTLGPNALVTREQLCVLLARLARQQGNDGARTDKPTVYPDDTRIDGWAQIGVKTVRNMGFVSKNDVELFRPRDWATRAEAAELLDWYLQL